MVNNTNNANQMDQFTLCRCYQLDFRTNSHKHSFLIPIFIPGTKLKKPLPHTVCVINIDKLPAVLIYIFCYIKPVNWLFQKTFFCVILSNWYFIYEQRGCCMHSSVSLRAKENTQKSFIHLHICNFQTFRKYNMCCICANWSNFQVCLAFSWGTFSHNSNFLLYCYLFFKVQNNTVLTVRLQTRGWLVQKLISCLRHRVWKKNLRGSERIWRHDDFTHDDISKSKEIMHAYMITLINI